ncbi:hypothetical protein [Candidatus Nitrosocosmicus hydrocola]|uniref:hypothetical protein n=1 Tax=Candidatus Nitrosocosmicus hydrocola TaxID=1826872 RepID=UPI0013728F2C|nr:hypothetical protein [Candidatus Nitrosocosmicus hydrocola]
MIECISRKLDSKHFTNRNSVKFDGKPSNHSSCIIKENNGQYQSDCFDRLTSAQSD